VRCAYPNPDLAAALATGLFGRVHVRLYDCDLRYKWGQFDSWKVAAYPGSRVFVGVVAPPEVGKDAYMFQKDLYYGILQFARKVPNYGGIMVWRAAGGDGSGGRRRKVEDLGEGKEKLTWRGGSHELGRRIGKLLKQIVFLGMKIFLLHP
jgi:hypothetical protein